MTAVVAIVLALGAAHLYLQAKFLSYFTIEEGVITDEKGFYSLVESEDWELLRDQLKSETNLLKTELLLNKHASGLADYVNYFRSDFELALNSADFSYISGYFPVSSQIQQDYIADINRHGAMSEYYYYDFISTSVIDVQAVDLNTIKVYTSETFNFTSGMDDLLYDKKKVYTIEVNDDMLYLILDIEQISSEKTAI